MSALAEKLRAMRRQSGAAEIGPTRPEPPGTVRDNLRRVLGVRDRLSTGTRNAVAYDRELPGDEIAPGLRLQVRQSTWPAAVIAHASAPDLAMLEGAAPARLAFFDTETTGLAGGTGTRAFQIGMGDWHDGGFRIRQLTMTSLAAEVAMLREFTRWLAPDCILVSYNGRSYDAPLLATRFRLARLPNALAGLAHLDLLHPVRRRYRGRWANCRLATVERELLGIVREDDLPGSEAPRAWLTFLRGGDATDLRRVGEHNAQDLRSLAALLVRLTAAT